MLKKNFTPILFSIAIVIASAILGKAYVDRAAIKSSISVSGLGSRDFTSNLIVWEGSFSKINSDMKLASIALEKDRKKIEEYLLSKQVSPDQIVFNSVNVAEQFKNVYSKEGQYTGQVFDHYKLTQSLQISSNEVEKIEDISRRISELLVEDIKFYSDAPRYYYTKLADLKLQLISEATEDARKRAEKIFEKSGGEIGALQNAQMGIFQITGQNSNEDYSWGGTYNTSSKEKSASITVKLTYSIK